MSAELVSLAGQVEGAAFSLAFGQKTPEQEQDAKRRLTQALELLREDIDEQDDTETEPTDA